MNQSGGSHRGALNLAEGIDFDNKDRGEGKNSNSEGHDNHRLDSRSHDAGDRLSGEYLDDNWTSNLLMDSGNEIFYNMGFEGHGDLNSATLTNPIVHNISYQNDVHVPDSKQPSQDNHQSFDVTKASDHTNNQLEQSVSSVPAEGSISASNVNQNNKSYTKQRRPCDHCRRRKTKCVIIPNTNNCVQCESKSLTCTYVGLAMKRKAVDTDSFQSLKRRGEGPNQHSNLGTPIDDKNKIIPPNVPIRDVPPVQDYSMMNNSLLRKTLSLQFPRSSFYVGPTSYLYDINLLNLIIDSKNNDQDNRSNNGKGNLGKIEQVNINDTISLRKVSDRVQFVLKDDQSPESYQTISNDVDKVEKFIAPHGQILIDLYFRIVHPSYPILHKKVFLEKYSRTHREFSAPLLAAVYVLAIQWWDYDPQLNRYPKPEVESILKIGLNNYLLEILKRPKLSAVQAGLLLLQCKHILRNSAINNSNSSNSSPVNAATSTFCDTDYSEWVLCSQVVSLAEELGLGLDCNNWKLPKWERGLRKRLAWATYMEDKWLALKNSRPSHINENNWVVVLLVEEDFPEKHGDGDLKEGSSDIDNGKKLFMNLIQLSTILSDILNEFYSMRAMNELTDINDVLKIAKPLQLRLRTWYHSLPIELQMSSVKQRKLCSNGYLQLAYFATELTLHRRIITTIYQQKMMGNNLPDQLVSVCRSAAETRLLASVEFVRDLKPEHIHSFWHSSSSSNFALIGTFAAILFISSSSKEEAEFYKDQIFNYRWILKISSKGFHQVGDALLKLDLILSHIPGLLNESAELPMVVPTVIASEDSRANGYNQNQPVSSSIYHYQGNEYSEINEQGRQHNTLQQPQYRMNGPQMAPPLHPTPPVSHQSMNIGGLFVSPLSSQSLSPKESLKQRSGQVSSRIESDKPRSRLNSKPNSPIITRSPNDQRRNINSTDKASVNAAHSD
ncbi:uncharacterized protein PRCAT00001181001 [Priceomyces carsonii]|uniref:uncharacterized protein n=1 Tax=Priceomyces carsonii TaxID=28549 RepID=UPI002EDA2FBA|nr:unnamed protein product [Priceomyces carsonii]